MGGEGGCGDRAKVLCLHAKVGEVRVRERVVGNVRGVVRDGVLMARACCGENETEPGSATEENKA